MTLTSCYPVLCTTRLRESLDFYTLHLDFDITFESDWYVSLRHRGAPHQELALLAADHPTLPESHRGATATGVLINIEVDDVDAQYARLVERAGLPCLLDLRTEDFGQRHFITRDPNGVLVDVITPVAPTVDFADQYS
ncbi:glyoxalase [Actinoalloteichus sp. AHMU CJ021]|uniref:Conserved protein PhnB, glyoxalase superfamily n=1 Tax=Actinoalloteichus caeruleus DSM 43889 TaxID=1120930 RepID=A0ABT1JPL2_ACTCY|nr:MULTISPECIES: VOC family protein [Actinoalloteichus]AUS79929.1 glyoxalase [Actinoalloteichus sp. AHMU CJ021]MCP2334109.1 putative conserved protein PhnB, glyoxalase superfamily [Actinoalloteichus caeruleus DSM 43889]